MFWEFFFILQIGIKIASTVPCFKPGNQKKHTKPTRPVKKYLLEGGLQKKTNKTTVDGPPLPGEDQWRPGMFAFTFQLYIYKYMVCCYMHNLCFLKMDR